MAKNIVVGSKVILPSTGEQAEVIEKLEGSRVIVKLENGETRTVVGPLLAP